VIALVAAGQFLYGLDGGIENANDGLPPGGHPDELQGRLNTTMRSVNRAIVVCAPVGGLLADAIGYWPTLWIAIVGFAVVAVVLAASPFRHARQGDRRPGRSSGHPFPRSVQTEELLALFDARDAHLLGPVRCQPGLPGEPQVGHLSGRLATRVRLDPVVGVPQRT